MSIIIGADFVPTSTNRDLFSSSNCQSLLGDELFALVRNADYRIFNLEMPLTDLYTPICKCGPNLVGEKDAINMYKALNVDLLTLANNHIMDQGIQGLTSTISLLKENNISYVGVGGNNSSSAQSFIADVNGKKIGVYACTEHEFSCATANTPGANPYDPLTSFTCVHHLKQQCDYVIILYHGGKELYRYPSPMLQNTCRKFVEAGADLVVCQHSHCIGCKEEFQNGTIIYGQGNFLFDYSDKEEWRTGILVSVADGKITYIPIIKKGNCVRIANEDKASTILKEFYKRSKQIEKKEFVEQNFKKFCDECIYGYLWQFSGATNSMILRGINKISGYRFYKYYVKKRYKKQQLLTLLDNIECEAHREVIVQGLKDAVN